ncbi:MAG: TAXI family TRAP transporter solute-binding subunit [Betaproteobacteria bacterium]|nr:MAG: TAXI family TRAP transporter solute-binding subunit [Betaproteobacteria bacterium]
MKTLPKRRFTLAATAVAALFAFSALQPAAAQERKSLRWATSAVGSYGYQIAASMTKIVEEALGGEYTVTVQPYTSPTVAMKAVMDGNGEIAYTADIGMTQFSQRIGGFKDYKAKMPELAHSWYSYPMESMMAVAAKDADKYKCWKDFSGKPVFYTNAGFMNWLNWQRIYKALGYEFKHVQIDLKSNADALQSGAIAASATYTTAGRSLASYWKETDIRMDVRVVNPCPDEVAKIKAAGLAVVDVDPKNAFSKPVGPAVLQGVPILFGYNMGTNIPEDVVYKMLSAFYKNKDSLAKSEPGFTPMARDFVGMQVAGISANPDIPVHPGLAKFLREHKAWNDKWKVAK